jgi:hypothetical protein
VGDVGKGPLDLANEYQHATAVRLLQRFM